MHGRPTRLSCMIKVNPFEFSSVVPFVFGKCHIEVWMAGWWCWRWFDTVCFNFLITATASAAAGLFEDRFDPRWYVIHYKIIINCLLYNLFIKFSHVIVIIIIVICSIGILFFNCYIVIFSIRQRMTTISIITPSVILDNPTIAIVNIIIICNWQWQWLYQRYIITGHIRETSA